MTLDKTFLLFQPSPSSFSRVVSCPGLCWRAGALGVLLKHLFPFQPPSSSPKSTSGSKSTAAPVWEALGSAQAYLEAAATEETGILVAPLLPP